MVRFTLLCSLLAALLWSAEAAAAEFSASVDRTQVSKDGYVLLTLKLVNSDTRLRARGVSPNVDLTLLADDFEVGVPHTRNRFNLYRGHGRATSELEVELFPKRRGTLTIPPFSVDGLQTKAIAVLVVPAAKNPTPDVFVKSGVTAAKVWLRQQTVAYLDLYYRVDLKDARLGEHIDTDPLDIDLDKLPQDKRKESIGAFTYEVERIGWAIMPLHSGKLTVTLPELWAQTAEGKKFHSPPQKQVIAVRPLPASVPPLTIVGRPELSADPPAGKAAVGKLAAWTVTLKAPTALDALPQRLPMTGLPEQLKFYFDDPELRKDVRSSGMVAVATYGVSAIPLAAGTYRIPAVKIPYFDPATGRMSSVTQPAVPLTVAATHGGAAPAAAARAPAPPRHEGSSQPAPPRYWQAGTAAFAALWLGTVALLWRRGRAARPRRVAGTPARAPRLPGQPLKERLLEAFGSPTLEEGLIAFERRNGVDDAVRETVRAVQRLYYGAAKAPAGPSLEAAVKQVAARIRAARPRGGGEPAADPWSPRSFTAGWHTADRTSGSG